MSKKDELILDFTDQDGKRYVFSKENFDKHKNKHPELLIKDFLQSRIKKTVCEPEFIYPAYKEKNRFCYYSQLDSLYFSPAKIQPHYSLFSINDELSVYIDKDSNIGGIFIEYYK